MYEKKLLLKNKAVKFFLQFVNNNLVYAVVSDYLSCDMCVRNKINSLVSKVKGAKGPGALYFLMEKKKKKKS